MRCAGHVCRPGARMPRRRRCAQCSRTDQIVRRSRAIGGLAERPIVSTRVKPASRSWPATQQAAHSVGLWAASVTASVFREWRCRVEVGWSSAAISVCPAQPPAHDLAGCAHGEWQFDLVRVSCASQSLLARTPLCLALPTLIPLTDSFSGGFDPATAIRRSEQQFTADRGRALGLRSTTSCGGRGALIGMFFRGGAIHPLAGSIARATRAIL